MLLFRLVYYYYCILHFLISLYNFYLAITAFIILVFDRTFLILCFYSSVCYCSNSLLLTLFAIMLFNYFIVKNLKIFNMQLLRIMNFEQKIKCKIKKIYLWFISCPFLIRCLTVTYFLDVAFVYLSHILM